MDLTFYPRGESWVDPQNPQSPVYTPIEIHPHTCDEREILSRVTVGANPDGPIIEADLKATMAEAVKIGWKMSDLSPETRARLKAQKEAKKDAARRERKTSKPTRTRR